MRDPTPSLRAKRSNPTFKRQESSAFLKKGAPKTFAPWCLGPNAGIRVLRFTAMCRAIKLPVSFPRPATVKSFLVLFFKKELLLT
jgi:hypothetical protein